MLLSCEIKYYVRGNVMHTYSCRLIRLINMSFILIAETKSIATE